MPTTRGCSASRANARPSFPRARPLHGDGPRPSTTRCRTLRRWREPPGTDRAACRSSATCRRRPPGRARGPHHVAGEIREIEMAMAIDQHAPLPSPGRRVAVTNRGKIPRGAGMTPGPGGRLCSRLGKVACIGGHRELIQQCSGRGGHKRLHQNSEMAQNLSQSIKNRLHPFGSLRRRAHGACSST